MLATFEGMQAKMNESALYLVDNHATSKYTVPFTFTINGEADGASSLSLINYILPSQVFACEVVDTHGLLKSISFYKPGYDQMLSAQEIDDFATQLGWKGTGTYQR